MDANSAKRFPKIASLPVAQDWFDFQVNRGLSPNTVMAYGYALEDFLSFCDANKIDPSDATRLQVGLYQRHLETKEVPLNVQNRFGYRRQGLSNASQVQRITIIRLFYDHLVEDGLREKNPIVRGRYVQGSPAAGTRGPIKRIQELPWIPNDEEWQQILEVVKQQSIRNRFMFALAYDGGLRREELCQLETRDIDPARRLVHIRAETTKNGRGRVIPFSEPTDCLFRAYLMRRREITNKRGPLFISESPRNRGEGITKWIWSKIVREIAVQSGIKQFKTHTLRHLCLTDLARAGWDIHEIAKFAGHKRTQTSLLYIDLTARDLAAKVLQGMNSIHQRRIAMIGEAFEW